jgi:hypothetical protein
MPGVGLGGDALPDSQVFVLPVHPPAVAVQGSNL